MRLWHKDLIRVLPRQQLLGQWRECCSIAKSIKESGAPNHILVNKIKEYPEEHFWAYAMLVRDDMIRRGYRCDISKFGQYCPNGWLERANDIEFDYMFIFYGWHTFRYLRQCYYNLQEKRDCGAISKEEWEKIEKEVEGLR